MPNKYQMYNHDIENNCDEEDREVENDLFRAQTAYYTTLNSINEIILQTMKDMSSQELKEAVRCNLKVVVQRKE